VSSFYILVINRLRGFLAEIIFPCCKYTTDERLAM